jgi:magnesium chelatase accessory protein
VPAWWPHRARSEFVGVGPLHWHVQRFGAASAPSVLLLHGTGAASHTWRHLAPLLAQRFHVLAPDLPGHGFTTTPAGQPLSLPAVAHALADLLDALALRPALVIGHSAGAAIAIRSALDGRVAPTAIVSINGAIVPPHGAIGRWFLPIGRLLAGNGLIAHAFAASLTLPGATRHLLASTGSRIDALGERCYAHLVRQPEHVAGALRLMAAWNLASMQPQLPALAPRLHLISGANDGTLPPQHADRVAALVPGSRRVMLPALGHLAHEEDAAAVLAALPV